MSKEMKYKHGDIVTFNFKPHSLDVDAPEVMLVGVVNSILYEEHGYDVRLSDKTRNIHGYIYVPESAIISKLQD
jgi:hypothetical protein